MAVVIGEGAGRGHCEGHALRLGNQGLERWQLSCVLPPMVSAPPSLPMLMLCLFGKKGLRWLSEWSFRGYGV